MIPLYHRIETAFNKLPVLNHLVKAFHKARTKWRIRSINRQLHHPKPQLFSFVEIETINRCNLTCDFCPVNKSTDPRSFIQMPDALFARIISELASLDYAGNLCLHSNNEPFIDDRIESFVVYARNKLPKAFIYIFTNGTLLTMDRFLKIIHYLDQLRIDNYSSEPKMHKNTQMIQEYCQKYPKINKKVIIHFIDPKALRDTRAGNAPNRLQSLNDVVARCSVVGVREDGDLKTPIQAEKRKPKNENRNNTSCFLPYNQIVFRPDGKCSLCCQDALGEHTLGDITKQNIIEIWNGQPYNDIRTALKNGRKSLKLCSHCDHFAHKGVYKLFR